MTSEGLALLINTLFGAGLAIVLEYFPGVKKWWEPLEEYRKRQLIALFTIGFGVLYFVGGCLNWLVYIRLKPVPCTIDGAWVVLGAIALGITSSQGLHSLVRSRKEE